MSCQGTPLEMLEAVTVNHWLPFSTCAYTVTRS
jgi:hypothetical protein